MVEKRFPKKGKITEKGNVQRLEGLNLGGVVELGSKSLKAKYPTDDANSVIPMPVTCWDAPKYTVKPA